MPSALDYILRKNNVLSELNSAQWSTVSAWLRERSFFMACVTQAGILQEFRNAVTAVTAGDMGTAEARQHMREFLAASGYQAPHGKEGSIKDLSSTQRLKVSIDTNVAMARGWMQRCRAMANTTRPAQELYRAWPAKQERDWPTRWERAAEAVGWVGVSPQKEKMIALKTSPIWVALSRFDQPYPPFDYGSHMRVRSVSLEKAKDADLLTTEEEYNDARKKMEEESLRSLNENVEINVQGWSYSLLKELAKQLKGLAVLDHGVLRMTDPNGTKPYYPEELARIISDPLPDGIPHLELEAVRLWLENSSRFNPLTEAEIKALKKWRKEHGDKPWNVKVSLDVKENLVRVMNRTISEDSAQALNRGIGFSSIEDYNSFLRDITNKGYYQALKGHVADSWTLSDATAEAYASKKKWQAKLICTHHKSAKDLRPLYRVARPQSSTPTKPLATEAELLIPGNVRLKVLNKYEKDVGGGKRLTIFCKEE